MLENKGYHTIKNLKIDNTEIEVCMGNSLSVEDKKNNLVKIYDVINEIAGCVEKRGIDTSKWFYTKKQLKQLKQDPTNKFI